MIFLNYCLASFGYLFFILLNVNATVILPMKGAVQYSHKSPIIPVNNDGASERIGFIDAPEIEPKKNTSSATVPAIIVLIKIVCSPLMLTAINILPIKKMVVRISIPKNNPVG